MIKSIADILPGVTSEIKVVTEEEIAADEKIWQDEQVAKRRKVILATKESELDSMGVPRRYADLLDKPFDFSIRPGMEDGFWKSIANTWGGDGWVTLIGVPGVGKTHVAIRLLWGKRIELAMKSSARFLWIDATRDAFKLVDRFNPDSRVLWDAIADALFIVLDDVGYLSSDQHKQAIASIIRGAESDKVQLIITSNCSMDGLKAAVGEASMSRITAPPNRVFVIKGRDVRQERK